MKRIKALFFLLCLAFLLFDLSSCGDEDPIIEIKDQKPIAMTVSLVSRTTSTAVFQWTPSNDPDGGIIKYYVEVGLGSNEILFGPSSDLQFTATDLEQGITYSLMVIAKDDEGDEGYSNLLEFSAAEIQVPNPFTVSVSEVDHESAKISWTATSNADIDPIYYEIFTVEDGIEVQRGGTYNLSFNVESFQANTTYNGFVRANAQVGSYSASHQEPFILTTSEDPHKITMDFSVNEYGFKYAKMVFGASSPISLEGTQYDVYLNGEEYAWSLSLAVQPDNEFLVEDLEGGAEHVWTIKATRGNQIYWSNELVYTTLETPLPDFDIEAQVEGDELTISWEQFNDETDVDGNSSFWVNNFPYSFQDNVISKSVDGANNRFKIVISSNVLNTGSNELYMALNWGLNDYYNTSKTITVTK